MRGHKKEPKTLTKKCTKCKRELPLDRFTRTNSRGFKDGLTFWCKDCQNDYKREYYKKEDKRQKLLRNSRRWGNKIRREAMEKLCGGEPECNVCGFKGNMKLLQLDHINNDGNIERNKHGTKTSYHGYREVLRLPLDEAKKRYQVLCVAHNWIKRYGIKGDKYALVNVN